MLPGHSPMLLSQARMSRHGPQSRLWFADRMANSRAHFARFALPPTSVVLALTAGGSTSSGITGTGATPTAGLRHWPVRHPARDCAFGSEVHWERTLSRRSTLVVSSRTGHCLHPRSSSSSIVFILVGIIVIFGWDKDIQTWVLENSPIAPWELDSGFIPDQ